MGRKKPVSKQTRGANSCVIILEESPGPEHLQIKHCKLPTRKQCLLSYLAHVEKFRSEGAKNEDHKSKALSSVADQVILHFNKSNIPVIRKDKVREKIEALFERYRRCQKMKNRIKSERNSSQLQALQRDLRLTMPFWPQNVMDIMEQRVEDEDDDEQKEKFKEDIIYLKDMMSNRIGVYTSLDTVTVQKIKEIEEKNERKMLEISKRKQREIDRLKENIVLNENQIDEVLNDVESENDADRSDDFVFQEPPIKKPRLHRRSLKTGQTLFIPHDILNSPLVVANALGNNISTTVLSSLFHDIIVSLNGDPNRFSISCTTLHR